MNIDTADLPLETPRLALRLFNEADAVSVQQHCSSRDIAATTYAIPHPYPDGAALEWINSHRAAISEGTLLPLAITSRETADILGAIELRPAARHKHAEVGYWIARDHWGNGYASEALARVLIHAFESLKLLRVFAHHMIANEASGKVMAKCGMKPEGTLRHHHEKWGVWYDIGLYGMIREDYDTARSDPTTAIHALASQ